MYLLNAAPSTLQTWKPVEPIVIAPGYAVTVVGQLANADVSTSYEWYEEAR